MGMALLTLYVALASPLDELAERMLSAHMTQHLLLMLAAAPLLVWSKPVPYLIWAFPLPLRRAAAHLWNRYGLAKTIHLIERPAICWAAFCGVIILWHVPAVYRWAMASEVRHVLMHLSFLGAGLLFWSVVLEPSGRRRLGYAPAALFVLSAALLTGLPGALIAFAQQPLYQGGMSLPNPFGLSALADQQLAGLIMWIPMDLILFGVAIALFGLALARPSPTIGITRHRHAA